MTSAPQTCGTVPDYLREAEARGVVPADFRILGLEPLTGGRTGARVVAIRPGYVLKVLPRKTWRAAATQAPDAGEGPLWLSGATRELPPPLACPTVDVAVHVDNDEWWMLMRDVSDGIKPRGAFAERDERVFLAAIARLHAHYWGGRNGLDRLPLAPVRGTTTALAEPIAYAAGRAAPTADWVPRLVEDFTPLRAMLPTYLEMLGPADADFFVQLSSDRSWHRGLDEATPTLNHGDLRRANIAFADERVTLIDWEFASRGPAACDLQHHWFLHFWVYPPADGLLPEDRAPLRDFYLAELEATLGRPIDRAEFHRTWDLAWLRVMSMLGFCFADVPDPAAPEARRRAKGAIALARAILDRSRAPR
ncbi:MAG TPA: phosphotransferase, partial [Burkholderiales bacterium]|nr:phosphotransferase [Burkholderiales bacterium]